MRSMTIGIILVLGLSPFLMQEAFAQSTVSLLNFTDFEIVRMNSNVAVTGSGNTCATAPRNISQDSTFTLVTAVSGSPTTGREVCNLPIVVVDISAIPDNATPIFMELAINVTASTDTLPSATNVDNGHFWAIFDEEVTGLTAQGLFDLTMLGGTSVAIDSLHFTISGDVFNGVTGQLNSTVSSPSAKLDGLKAQLASGRDYYNLFACPLDTGGAGCAFSTNQDGSASAVYDQDTSFLLIEWEIFTVPSEPLSLTNVYSASPDECTIDWEAPADDGGLPVLGYQIERSINLIPFSILVADTGSPVPTDFTEATSAGNSHRYRVSAINDEGIGSPATTTNSCGIPSIADPPFGLIAFEEPDNDITIDWETPTYDGGLPIAGYLIERQRQSDPFQVLVPNTFSTDTTFVDIGVQANVDYTYRISTINTEGTSTPSVSTTFKIIVSGGGGQSEAPVAPPPSTEDGFTQAEFDLALAQAIAQIQPQQVTVVETIVSQIFEFAIVDTGHEELVLNSFLQDQRLGIRWSSGQDIIITSVVASPSPFLITFEQVPVIKQGSGAVVSTDFIMYNLQVPSQECGGTVTENCVLPVRYEVPVTVTALLGNSTITDTGNITIDLVDDIVDPILVLLLATFGIPLVAGLVQRSRGQSGTPPVKDLFKGV